MATLGNAATNNAASGGTLDLSLTVQAADDKIIVGAGADFTEVVTGVQIDPGGGDQADFTQSVAQARASTSTCSIWFLDTVPSAGTYTIRVTWDGSAQGKAAYARALQSAASGAAESTAGRDVEAGGGGNDTASDLDVTGVSTDSFVFDMISLQDAVSLTVDASQTEEINVAPDNRIGGSHEELTSGGPTTVTMSWTFGADIGSHCAAAYAAAAGGATPTAAGGINRGLIGGGLVNNGLIG